MFKQTPKQKAQQHVDALIWLEENIKPGTTIYTTLVKVSANGMSRHIKTAIILNNEIVDIGYHVAKALNYRLAKHNNWSIVVQGCGKDMGYHIVNSLSVKLFCKDGYNHDGAYSLKHKWL